MGTGAAAPQRRPAAWARRVLWLAAIWAASVVALGIAAACLRLAMKLAGLTAT